MSIKTTLTIDRVRRFINDGILPSASAEELQQIWEWLDDLSTEIGEMKEHIDQHRVSRWEPTEEVR